MFQELLTNSKIYYQKIDENYKHKTIQAYGILTDLFGCPSGYMFVCVFDRDGEKETVATR